jgi:chromosomal replication initiator protein
LPPADYERWIAPLRVQTETGDELVLEGPNASFVQSLEESLRALIDREVAQVADELFQVVITAADEGSEAGAAASERDPACAAQSEVHVRDFRRRQLRTSSPTPPPAPLPRARRAVTTRSSSTAASASARPIFCTPSAIRWLAVITGLKVLYLTAEQFVNQLHQLAALQIDACFPRALPGDRRAAGRRHPVLRQQGAHAGRVLPHLQHALHESEADRALFRYLASLDATDRGAPALAFRMGTDRRHPGPDLETKIAILRRKADLDGARLPDDVALFVAHQVRSNVRELEGLLNRVVAFASLTGKPLSLDLAKETLKDILPDASRRPVVGGDHQVRRPSLRPQSE